MTARSSEILVVGYPCEIAALVASRLAASRDRRVMVMAKREELGRVDLAKAGLANAEPVEGDFGRIDFGMTGREYLALARTVTEIHCLAGHDLAFRAQGRNGARELARELVELALASGRLRRVVVLSHVDVAGRHSGRFFETDLDVGQRFAADDQNARFVLERILRRFTDTVPTVFLRTGWLPGAGLGMCPIAHLLLAAPELSSKHSADPVLLTDPLGLREICASLDDVPVNKGGLTLHLVPSVSPTFGALSEAVWRSAREIVPASYDLAAGARRVVKELQETSGWSARELARRVPCAAHRVDRTAEILARHSLCEPAVTPERLAAIAQRAAEEIVGFR